MAMLVWVEPNSIQGIKATMAMCIFVWWPDKGHVLRCYTQGLSTPCKQKAVSINKNTLFNSVKPDIGDNWTLSSCEQEQLGD